MPDLTITGAAVYLDGRRAANLLWSGRCVKVESLRGKGLGRLLPAGYAEGRPEDGSGRYDLWTAKHPHVHVPSDVIVAEDLTLEACVLLLLEGALSHAARLRALLRERPGPRRGLRGRRRGLHGARRHRHGHRSGQEQEEAMAVGDISSIPVWAQKHIARVEQEAARDRQALEHWKARNAVGMEDSTVIADPYSEAPRPLGTDTDVRFQGALTSFTVRWDSSAGVLDITATGNGAMGDGIAVYPSTGNSVRLKGGRP